MRKPVDIFIVCETKLTTYIIVPLLEDELEINIIRTGISAAQAMEASGFEMLLVSVRLPNNGAFEVDRRNMLIRPGDQYHCAEDIDLPFFL